MARTIDTNSLDKPAPVEIPMHDSITDDEIMRVPSAEKMDHYANDLAFAEEMVEFEVQTTSDPNAEPVITCGVNGVMRSFVRGVRYKDKRKFLEAVLSAKQRIVQTPEVVDPNTGERRSLTRKITTDYYGVAVYGDSARGEAWLRALSMRH